MSDAWRYCENIEDPEAVKKLVQAVLMSPPDEYSPLWPVEISPV